MGNELLRFLLLARHFHLQGGYLSVQRLPLTLQQELSRLDLLPRRERPRRLLGLLRQPGGAGQHTGFTQVNVAKLYALIGQEEFADLVGVRHSSRLQHV